MIESSFDIRFKLPERWPHLQSVFLIISPAMRSKGVAQAPWNTEECLKEHVTNTSERNNEIKEATFSGKHKNSLGIKQQLMTQAVGLIPSHPWHHRSRPSPQAISTSVRLRANWSKTHTPTSHDHFRGELGSVCSTQMGQQSTNWAAFEDTYMQTWSNLKGS